MARSDLFYYLCLIQLFCGNICALGHQHVLLESIDPRRWQFNFSSPAPHLFASVQGLLQQWPNTFFPNGHSIVPCEISPFTNLYHGWHNDDPPLSPEWVAFDIEMSYGIMGSGRSTYMFTYQTTRRVKCLYFDGESAALAGTGQLDTQMLFVYGNTTGNVENEEPYFLSDEYDRATRLCNWIHEKGLGGPGWGIEGIVRMNTGFEMIWCNFSSPSLRLVSRLNVSAPLFDDLPTDMRVRESFESDTSLFPLPTMTMTSKPRPTRGTQWRGDFAREPFVGAQLWQWFVSATRHYGLSKMGPGIGESRVRPATCGFLSFYSSILQDHLAWFVQNERSSLNLSADGLWSGVDEVDRPMALQTLMRRRRSHVLQNASRDDAQVIKDATERVLRSLEFDRPGSIEGKAYCSGVDWHALANEIMMNYSGSLQDLLESIKKTIETGITDYSTTRDSLMQVRDHTHALLLPVLEYPSTGNNAWDTASPFAQEVSSRCRYQYTRLLVQDEGVSLNPEESTLKNAVDEVMGAICTLVVKAGFSVENVWLAKFNSREASGGWKDGLDHDLIWLRHGVEELMAWLGWEYCFIPMWPVLGRHGGNQSRPHRPYSQPKHGTPGYQDGYEDPGYDLGPNLPAWWTRAGQVEIWTPQCIGKD